LRRTTHSPYSARHAHLGAADMTHQENGAGILSYQLKQTLMITNAEALQNHLGQETLVVCGAPRGMTSLVAYFLYESGYFIGNTLSAEYFEDQEFLHAIPPAELPHVPLQDSPAFLTLVQSRNTTHPRWGFKLPRAAGHIDALKNTLRNPIFVFCVRNPVATIRSIMKYEANHKFTAGKLMEIATRHFAGMTAMCNESEFPAIFVDMDAVRQHPETFLKEFAEVLSLPEPSPELCGKISTRGYKTASPRDGVTFRI
jgi:hypothetical protein